MPPLKENKPLSAFPGMDPRAIAPNNPNELLVGLFHSGQAQLAEQTERDTVSKNPTSKIYSMACERWLAKYIGHHSSVIELKEKVRKLAVEDDPVLIVGPSGTGKELIARALHGRRPGKFEAINCTALPSELLESELFGHVKGAFTGAVEDRIGKFRAAFNGTLFLDEIGDMPVEMQAKLLRVLQEQEVTPLGSDKAPEKIKCRIVAATNKPIDTLLGNIHFREDLYWRLAAFCLETLALIAPIDSNVPSRIKDIHEIMDSLGGTEIMTKFDAKYSTPDFEHWIEAFGYLKGNVRELQALVRRYQVFGELPLALR